MEVRIDLRRSLPENAKFYYDRSKKARDKIGGAEKAISDTKKKLDGLKDDETMVESITLKKKKSKKWFEKFRWFESSDGFLVIGGRDATSNEVLIKKHLEANDIVFHADYHGAPFFIVKNPDNREVPEQTKKEASEAAASYSKAWGGGKGSCDVYYINPDQVSKSPPSGEYLTKGAFMIYGKKNFFRGVSLKVAVGFKVGEEAEVIGGPIDAIAKQTKNYVIIGVGEDKSGELARTIKSNVMKSASKEDGGKIKAISLGDIQYWIPSGKGRLLFEK